MNRAVTMRRPLWIAALLGLLAGPASAQPPDRPVAPATEADVRKLLEATGQANLSRQVMDSVLGSLRPMFPAVPEALWAEIVAELQVDQVTGLVVPIYMKYLTDEDVRGLIAFYESPVGRKLVEVQPLIVKDSMAVGRKWGEEAAGRVIRRLQQKGYRPKTASR